MKGYKGSILRINLKEKTSKVIPLDEELIKNYTGGTGINTRLFFSEVEPTIDPLGPLNKIIIGTGPCNGTLVPGSQRFTITAKSPLTGIWGDANSGGSFGARLKFAGYDHVIIEDKAEKPVYIFIDNDIVQIRTAEHLWGKTTKQACRTILKEIGDPNVSVISIGPAGENMVKIANIICDLGRGLGRAGMGAVLGSKKIKAIAVRGTGSVEIADSKSLNSLIKQIYKSWEREKIYLNGRNTYGPALGWKTKYTKYGMLPTKNYTQGDFGTNLMDPLVNYFVKPKACFSCPAACNHLVVITKGAYKGTYLEGSELSNLGDFGAKTGIDNLDLILKSTSLCDELGIDQIDMGGLLSFVMECFEKGILSEKDRDGLNALWGDTDTVLNLVKMTAYKKGIGAILSEGLKGASEIIGRGSEKYALHSKNMALIMRDPRVSKGWGLMYAVSTRGACHVRSHMPEWDPEDKWDSMNRDIFAKYKNPVDPLSENAKGSLAAWWENLVAFQSSMELCLFSIYPWMDAENSEAKLSVKLFNAVTGLNISPEETLEIGERIINIQKAFNVILGFDRKDDSLPERFLKEPMPNGIGKGQTVKLDPMLDEYYEYRGWDKNTSFPTRAKLLELGLNDVIDKLDSIGKLR